VQFSQNGSFPALLGRHYSEPVGYAIIHTGPTFSAYALDGFQAGQRICVRPQSRLQLPDASGSCYKVKQFGIFSG